MVATGRLALLVSYATFAIDGRLSAQPIIGALVLELITGLPSASVSTAFALIRRSRHGPAFLARSMNCSEY